MTQSQDNTPWIIANNMDLFRCQDKTTAIAEPRPIPDCAAVVCITSASIIVDLLPNIILYVFPDNAEHDTENTNVEKKNVVKYIFGCLDNAEDRTCYTLCHSRGSGNPHAYRAIMSSLS